MKTIILTIATALLLMGCQKEKPNYIELTLEANIGGSEPTHTPVTINNELKYISFPYKVRVYSDELTLNIYWLWLDKWRPTTVKIIVHDKGKQVFIHDVISEMGVIEYDYKSQR